MTWVKICGLRRPDDVAAAVEAGADAIGFVLHPESVRAVTAAEARQLGDGAPVIRVAVTVDRSPEELLDVAARAGVDGVQPHGRDAARAARAAVAAGYLVLRPLAAGGPFRLEDIPAAEIPLFDTGAIGGSGRRFDWDLIPVTSRRFVLAGGLDPAVVAEAVRTVRPWGVDASSGLESTPGVKDPRKITAFVENAKQP